MSSPSVANYALKRVAEDHREVLSAQARLLVQKGAYVDDLAGSMDTEEEAARVRDEVTEACARAGFPLHQWKSSSPVVVAPSANDEDVPLGLEVSGEERLLGLVWEPSGDFLGVRSTVPCSGAVTRRSILSTLGKLYDPIGLLTPYTITARLLFQNTCGTGLDWDQELAAEDAAKWRMWTAELSAASLLRFPRTVQFGPAAELHVFCDGSTSAYGAVAYVRSPQKEGWKTTLLTSRARGP